MASRRKFRVGPVVHSFEELFQHDYFMLRQGSKWKTVHNAFVRSWQGVLLPTDPAPLSPSS